MKEKETQNHNYVYKIFNYKRYGDPLYRFSTGDAYYQIFGRITTCTANFR